MKELGIALSCLAVILSSGCSRSAQASLDDRAVYRQKYYDPLLEKMRKENKEKKKKARALTSKIRKAHKEALKLKRKKKKILLFDMKGVRLPPSPEAFKQAFHFPPVAQYYTGTCWAFAATSFFESEVHRLSGKRIKLSEMHTVYYEYLEKARRFIQKRGNSYFAQGSQFGAVKRMFKKYGAMPAENYPGVKGKDKKHNHHFLYREMKNYLKFIKKNNYWDEKSALASIRVILDKYMGRPPTQVRYRGREMSPQMFIKKELRMDIDDYVEVMSTKKTPFYSKALFDVPDNWWKSRAYHNVPLPVFYQTIGNALRRGYTVAIGGDVSEPGKNGFKDAMVIPDYDLPRAYINQDSREYRIFNKSTTDDHGIHLVGYLRHASRDWFLSKDSARSARQGRFKGYYFVRADFIKLKMLSFMVHKDAFKEILRRF